MGLTSSQHGQPMQILDMGETALDEQIFEEYLAEMREQYTADKVWVCFLLPTMSDRTHLSFILVPVPVQYHLLGKDPQHTHL